MTFEQLMKLLDAGFTKAEIMALNGTPAPAPQPELEPQPEQAPAPQPKPEPKPEQAPAPQPKPEPQPDPAPAPQNDQAAILAKLEELNQTIIRSNINHSEQPETESVDDILATIIRPTFKNKEEK